MMRVLALLVALFGMPALAADYTPWPEADEPAACRTELAQAPGNPGQYCCVHCRQNEVPCGRSCIAKNKNGRTICKQPAGCACPGKP